MPTERWKRIQRLFAQARELQDQRRREFLSRECGEDAALRTEIESLLAHHNQAARMFDTSQVDVADGEHASNMPEKHPPDPSSLGQTESLEAGGGFGPPTFELDGYSILRTIDRGGQGAIYEAIQKSTGSKVAIKVLKEGIHATQSARRRFEREIEIIAQVRHPNIAAIHDSGATDDGRQYFVMDYIQGVSIRDFVRRKKLNSVDTLRLFLQVCVAMKFVHEKGVVHRDLKPSNILVDATGRPQIIDFGLAKSLAARHGTVTTLSNDILGTLPYMAPEQTSQQKPDPVDTRTDIYALGVILYELLTGTYPYPRGSNLHEAVRHILDTPPSPPTRVWNEESGVHRASRGRFSRKRCPIDDDMETIVLKTLAKEPSRRYQSASELHADIVHYLAGEPIEAKRDSSWYVLRKWAARNRVTAAAAASILIALASNTWISWQFYGEARSALADKDAAIRMASAKADELRELATTALSQFPRLRLGWFVAEWEADRTESARGIRDDLPSGLPERQAMTYLLDEGYTLDMLFDDLDPSVKFLGHFVNGERLRKTGRYEDAIQAYQSSLRKMVAGTAVHDGVLQPLVRSRLALLARDSRITDDSIGASQP